jgi:hypothetical protein
MRKRIVRISSLLLFFVLFSTKSYGKTYLPIRIKFQFVNLDSSFETKFLNKINRAKLFSQINEPYSEAVCKLIYSPSGWEIKFLTPLGNEVYKFTFLYKRKNPSTVFRKFKREISKSGTEIIKAIYKGLIEDYLNQRQLDKAELYLEEAISVGISESELYSLKNQIEDIKSQIKTLIEELNEALNRNDYVKGIETLNQIIKLVPYRSDFKERLTQLKSDAKKYYISEIRKAMNNKSWVEAKTLLDKLVSSVPEVEGQREISSLEEKIQINIKANSLLEEARRLYNLSNYNLALEKVKTALQLIPENKEALKLKEEISYQLAERHFMDGQIKEKLNPVNALDEYLEAEELYPKYPDLKKKIKEMKIRLTKIYLKEAENDKKNGRYANALLKYFAISLLEENLGSESSKEIQKEIKNLKRKLRERAKIRIGIAKIQDYSQKQELAMRFVNGIFNYLFNKTLPSFEVRDTFSNEKGLTLDLKLDGFIYPLEIEKNKYVSEEKRKVMLATEKIPNPKREELLSKLKALGAAEPFYEQKAVQSFRKGVNELKSLSILDDLGSEFNNEKSVEMLSYLYNIGKSYQYSAKAEEISRKIEQLEEELKKTPEFIEQPVYGVVEAYGETHIKLAHLACVIRIKDLKTDKFIFSKEFEKFEVASDVFVKGDERLGIKGDPLELPTDLEMKEKVYRQLLEIVNQNVFNYIKDLGLRNYYLLLESISEANLTKSIENGVDFLYSISAQFYPDNSKQCAKFLELYIKELVGKKLFEISKEKLKSLYPEEVQEII